jgi:hypothetical protein
MDGRHPGRGEDDPGTLRAGEVAVGAAGLPFIFAVVAWGGVFGGVRDGQVVGAAVSGVIAITFSWFVWRVAGSRLRFEDDVLVVHGVVRTRRITWGSILRAQAVHDRPWWRFLIRTKAPRTRLRLELVDSSTLHPLAMQTFGSGYFIARARRTAGQINRRRRE